jgi:hypothetical protein
MRPALRNVTSTILWSWATVVALGQDGFQVTFKNEQNDLFSSIKQTTDSGFIACGFIHTNDVIDDILLVRMNAHGDTMWTRTYGGGYWSDDRGACVIQASDGFFYMTGQEQTYDLSGQGWGNNLFLMKVDTTGALIWARTHWVPNSSKARDGRDLFEMPDGGFAVVGWPELSVYRFDADGELTWVRTYAPIWRERSQQGSRASVRRGQEGSRPLVRCGQSAYNAHLFSTRRYAVLSLRACLALFTKRASIETSSAAKDTTQVRLFDHQRNSVNDQLLWTG